ncbi:hypothetical protein [Pseudomonas sp. TE3610]
MHHDSQINRRAGELDTGFGDQGQLRLAHGTICDFLADQGGATLALARQAQAFVLSRFDAAGSVDSSFGVAGYRVDSFDPLGHSTVSALRVAADGAIAVAGRVRLDGVWRPVVARYGADGEVGKKTILDLGTGRPTGPPATGDRLVFAFHRPSSQGGEGQSSLVAVDDDNQLDVSFNGCGHRALAFLNGTVTLTCLQPTADGYLFGATQGNTALIGRLLHDGTPDGRFGDGGYFVRLRPGHVCAIHALLSQADGRIIAYGSEASLSTGEPHLVIWALDARGQPLPGMPQPLLPGLRNPRSWACGLAADGKPVMAGAAQEAGDYRRAGILARFVDAQQLDPDFGVEGIARSAPYREYVCLLPQADGDVLVGGHQMDEDFVSQAMVQRYRGV